MTENMLYEFVVLLLLSVGFYHSAITASVTRNIEEENGKWHWYPYPIRPNFVIENCKYNSRNGFDASAKPFRL